MCRYVILILLFTLNCSANEYLDTSVSDRDCNNEELVPLSFQIPSYELDTLDYEMRSLIALKRAQWIENNSKRDLRESCK
jgi:hypothetical protein